MHEFRRILFVNQGFTDCTEAMKQAMSLARNNDAELDGPIVCPEVPSRLVKYRDRFQTALKETRVIVRIRRVERDIVTKAIGL